MPKLLFNEKEYQAYFSGIVKHKAYNDTVNMAFAAHVHAEGIYPKEMIEERRPSEGLQVKEYREKIWKPITKPTWGKVLTELNKIRRSTDWSVKYDDTKNPPRIVEGERLKDYCEEGYPFFESITNWAFSTLLPLYCKDANAVVAVMPIETDIAQTDYLKPYAYTFNSARVFDFVENNYAVIQSTDKVLMTFPDGIKAFGNVFYFFTTMWTERWEQAGGVYKLKHRHDHNLGRLPVRKVKGLVKDTLDEIIVFKSRLSDMLPRLDEAIREYSDLQAEVVQNIFTERWEIVAEDCPECKGRGIVQSAGFNSKNVECHTCHGSGAKQRNPYSVLQVKQGMAGEKGSPIPPAGLIQKDTSIVKIQDERIDKHLFQALSAINMEYLANTPLAQSGVGKEVDRDPANTFCHSIAEDIVAIMDFVYLITCEMRYNLLIADSKDRRSLLPIIPVPEKFDLINSTYLQERLNTQKEKKGNPIIINAMEEELINKQFIGDHALREKILLSMKLDPLAGVSEEDKIIRLSNKGITQAQYIISCNVEEFIERAIDEKKEDGFRKMKLKDQKQLMMDYAKEQIEEDSSDKEILSEFGIEKQLPGEDPNIDEDVEPITKKPIVTKEEVE